MMVKTCTKCETTKPISEFHPHKGGAHGVKSQCKDCVRERNRAYNKANPDVMAKIAKKQEQRPRVKEYRKTYRTANKALFRHHNMRRYVSKKSATPNWLTQDHLNQIAMFYQHARDCEIVTGELYHVDHIIPIQGKDVCGLHVPWNLQVLPADVNIRKSNKHGKEASYHG